MKMFPCVLSVHYIIGVGKAVPAAGELGTRCIVYSTPWPVLSLTLSLGINQDSNIEGKYAIM
jgi:hypothetical protein